MNENISVRKDEASEAQLQYYYIAKAREYVKAESECVGPHRSSLSAVR